jgi:hypothetical protein
LRRPACRGALYHCGTEGEGDSPLYMMHGTLWPEACDTAHRLWAREALHLLDPRPDGCPPYCESEETALPNEKHSKVESKQIASTKTVLGEPDVSAADMEDVRRKAAMHVYPFSF